MLLLLRLAEAVLLRLLCWVLLFRKGYSIEFRLATSGGCQEIVEVRSFTKRLLRGIRYIRGKEGVPKPVCENCGAGEAAHTIACPEEVPTYGTDGQTKDGTDAECDQEGGTQAREA